MSKQQNYKIIRELITENEDLIDFVRDMLAECYKDDQEKLSYILSEFNEGIDMPTYLGGCPSFKSLIYRYDTHKSQYDTYKKQKEEENHE